MGKNTRTVTTKFQDANGSDVLIGAVTAVMDTDWEGVKTCTDTTWKNNTNPWIRAPLSTKVYSGPGTVFDGEHCAASAPLLSRKSNQYDNDAPNLTKGLLTKVSTNTSGSQWSHASTTYDDYGRVTSVTDANGNTTETLYNGMTSISSITNDLVTQTKVKLPKATSSATTRFVITTELDPRRGTPTLVTDPNGNITRLTHDPLGRLTQVRYPGNGATSDPSVEYTYTVTPTTPSKVKTRVQRAAGCSTSPTPSTMGGAARSRPRSPTSTAISGWSRAPPTTNKAWSATRCPSCRPATPGPARRSCRSTLTPTASRTALPPTTTPPTPDEGHQQVHRERGRGHEVRL